MRAASDENKADSAWNEKIRKLSFWFSQYALQILVLALVTVVQLFFISQKEGYHMDELLSYELSNAQFNPWIVPTQPQGRLAKLYQNEIQGDSLTETMGNLWRLTEDVLRNRGNSLVAGYQADVYEEPVWISGKEFHDYITVEEDAFNYLSVYFNVKDDNHPPLHFMVLHTISSLVRGKILPLMGCSINLICVLGCCILLMKLGKRLGLEKAGLASAVLYGLSSGAIATVLLTRMYGMMTFWCVADFYLHIKKWQEKEWTTRNRLLILVTVMGFWTQYFFLFYCIGLAAVVVFLFCRDRNWKALRGYIRSMIIAAVIGLAVFPFAVSDVFSSGRGVEALENLRNGLKGYGTRLWNFGKILASGILGMEANGWILAAALCLASGVVLVLIHRRTFEKEEEKNLAGMLLVPVCIYFFLAARMSPYMVDRYIMALFPFAVLGMTLLLWKIVEKISAGVWIFGALIAVLCFFNVCGYSGEYLYKGYEKQLEITKKVTEEYGGLPCICIYEGAGYYENLVEFTCYRETLLLTPEELCHRKDKDSVSEKEQVVVLVKNTGEETENAVLEKILEEEYGLKKKDILLSREESPYGDLLILFGK